MGYIIYNESNESEDICCNHCVCCEDCKVCCETLNISLCCYSFGCKCLCKCIFCRCYSCYCDKIDKNNRYRMRKIKDINKLEYICIFYRVTGIYN